MSFGITEEGSPGKGEMDPIMKVARTWGAPCFPSGC